MWYDVLVAGILIFFTLRGAMRGVVWQIAGIAGIVICFMFADAISNAVGPYIHLEPPLNHWVALAGAYLALSFVCFGLARAFHEWMEKNKLKEFDRHLGAVFGLVKGLILALVLTFFVVTVSEKAHERLKDSYSARYSAIIMDRLHPVLPARLHDSLAKYIHSLDADNLPLNHRHDVGHDHSHSDANPFGAPGPIVKNNPPVSLWDQLSQSLTTEAQRLLSGKLQQVADPAQRARLQQDMDRLIKTVPPQNRETVLREIANTGVGELERYLGWKLNQLADSNPPAPIQPASGSSSFPANPFAQENPFAPETPRAAGPSAQQQIGQLVQEVAGLYTPDPNVRLQYEQNINYRISGLPESVCLAVLQDWKADVTRTGADPDPGTNLQTSIEQRVLRQLQSARIGLEQLLPDVKQRLLPQAQAPQGTLN